MNADTTNIIFGPPGTGKTTELLKTVELLLDDGFAPEDIGFIAFTRKAASEAKYRAMTKFGLSDDRLPWFRTLHSLAFAQLGITRSQVMGLSDYIKLAQMLGIFITTRGIAEDGTLVGLSKGDRLFFMEAMSRATITPLKDYWSKFPDEDIYWYELERLANTLKLYKSENDKRDFTDMVHDFIESPQDLTPGIRVLIVDEAQDLTPLQWRMIDRMSVNVEELYIAGDDDQAIFRWAGADVDHFIKLQGHPRVLDQSWRCPKSVTTLANTISDRITTRVPKKWNPRDCEGVINYETTVESIDMAEGTWLLLGRNTYILEQFNNYCMQQGYIFTSQLGSPISGANFKAIQTWERLRAGGAARADQVVAVYDMMSVRNKITYGCKTKLGRIPGDTLMTLGMLRSDYGLLTEEPWTEAMDRMEPVERGYFLAALNRGEKMDGEPRIRISTIHGAKGGEAQNVVIATDMADRTWNEMQAFPDDEHRVWYVGVTRAKERLIILQPTTNKCYSL